jgi:hypothetical protein
VWVELGLGGRGGDRVFGPNRREHLEAQLEQAPAPEKGDEVGSGSKCFVGGSRVLNAASISRFERLRSAMIWNQQAEAGE